MVYFIYSFGVICTLFSFLYGVHISFKDKGVLFLQIITCAFGCFFLHDIYNLCYFLCFGYQKNAFNISDLGYMGGMFFLISSYCGAMDRIGEEYSKNNLFLFKILPFFISAVNVAFNLSLAIFFDWYYIADVFISSFISSIVIYFCFKSLILPDIENGIIKSLRIYNFLLIIFCISFNLQNTFFGYNLNFSFIFKIITCVLSLFIIPTAKKGVAKWYI